MSKMWERADFWPTEPSAAPVQDDFARGLAEARRTVEAELAGEREALLQLVTSLEVLQSPSSALIASLIVAAVEQFVTDIAGQAPVDGALLRERAESLAASIAEECHPVLVVHPDDAALLELAVPVVGDPLLARGTVQLRTECSIHEDGVAPALDRMRTQMSRLGLGS
jgi:hypothetical protein